jgi:GT2 family glycosyltransferase
MPDRERVSVVIVTLDRRDDLAECLGSVAQQTLRPHEIVVVDNRSTDGTAAMLAERFPEVRVLTPARNTGCPGGRNLGVEAATGDYVFFLDDDATLDPDALAQAVAFLKARPVFAAVGIAVVSYWPDGRVQAAFDPVRLGERPRLYPNFSGGASLVRRADFLAAGGFNADFVYGGEERELSLRFLLAGRRIAYLPAVRMFHKQSPGRLRDETARLSSGLRNDLYFLWRYYPVPLAAAATANKARFYVEFARSKGRLAGLVPDLVRIPWTAASIAWAGRRPVPCELLFLLKLLERFRVAPDDPLWNRALDQALGG